MTTPVTKGDYFDNDQQFIAFIKQKQKLQLNCCLFWNHFFKNLSNWKF